jgi:choline-sulfatase
VPLLIKLPGSGEPAQPAGAEEGKTVAAQVETTDILPTVLDLLSIPMPAAFAGRSMSPYFQQTNDGGRKVFAETDYPLSFGWAPLRAVRMDGFKFIEAPQPELYDLAKDPGELKNEYEPWNETVKRLRAELVSSPMRPPRLSPSTGTAGNGTLSELRALGYLGPGDKQTSTNVPEFSSLPDPKDKIEEQNLLHSAMMAVDQGRVSEAQTLLKKVLQLNPGSPAALRQLGELEFNSAEYRKAADDLERARKAHPDDAMAAVYEGQALERLGDLLGARKVLEAAVTQSPGKLDARLLLASIDLKSGDRGAAEDQFEAVLLLDASNQDALSSLGKAYLEEKRFGDVVALLEPHAKDAAVNVEEMRVLAQGYEGLGRSGDANKVRAEVKRLEHSR